MSGVAVIRYLLTLHAPLTALVPVARIVAGEPDINAVLPLVAVMKVGSSPRTTLAMSGTSLHRERVQVSVLVKASASSPAGLGYPGLQSLLTKVYDACPYSRGTLNSIVVDSIIPDIEGPDMLDFQTGIYQGSRDFIVNWRNLNIPSNTLLSEDGGVILRETA